MYSVIAGFVEPEGPIIEEAVVHQGKEELGIVVQVIRYVGSQPWPFPHSPTIAYTATSTAGKISIDDSENEEASWFTLDYLLPFRKEHRSQTNRLVR
jgi:NAD+ diphosphatase